MSTLIHALLVDTLIDAYVTWRDACGAVNEAYHAWGCATRPAANVAFVCYSAALDQEERAAEAYARSVASVAQAVAASAGLDPVMEAPAWKAGRG